ncbi:hypothetical protein JTB14_037261 [Gonioctena quinquepunctata]|nr:hypothetical protein JTB14_037261 [Gonioctena quinquepunctata]
MAQWCPRIIFWENEDTSNRDGSSVTSESVEPNAREEREITKNKIPDNISDGNDPVGYSYDKTKNITKLKTVSGVDRRLVEPVHETSLHIFHINTQSLNNNIDQLDLFFLDNEYDIIYISEHWFKEIELMTIQPYAYSLLTSF